MPVRAIPVAIVLLLLVSVGADAGGTWQGRVVDDETGQLLEGVVIVAYWLEYDASLGGWGGGSFVACEDTVTGADGTFALPRHRVYTIPALLKVTASVVVFKPGYVPMRGGGFSEAPATVSLRRPASREERLNHYSRAEITVRVPTRCTQNLRRAIGEERRALGLTTR